jgi:uncharacterized protein (TIGR03032 family)
MNTAPLFSTTSAQPEEELIFRRQDPAGNARFQMVSSRGFVAWLAQERISILLTTYHVGALILLGRKPAGDVSMYVSIYDRAMGVWPSGQSLWLATALAIWRLENSLAPGTTADGFDRVYVPRTGYITGDLDIHDLALGGDGRPVFVNTRFNCLATVDERYSFAPLWRPPFISSLSPEDRCHLNGMVMHEGRPKYVTVVAPSDVADGWRDFRDTGGQVLEVPSGAVLAGGLSMPHSPRMHGGRLWLLNAGSGELGFIDLKTCKFEPIAFLPGYARGLAFHGKYAIVGLSKPRREHAFQGLPLERTLAAKGAVPRCGIQVVDTTNGAVAHWVRIESTIEELYDVAVLPDVVRPKALCFATPSISNQLSYLDGGRHHIWTAPPTGEPLRAAPSRPGGT